MTDRFHILVVDDDRRVRSMLRRYLCEEGFIVTEAESGAAMRSAFEAGTVDLVLLDLIMPGEDGFTLARYIRQCGPTPIIMLTGKGDVIDRVAGLEAGADDYIPKPFHLREVLARIRTVLRRAQPPPWQGKDGPAAAVVTGASGIVTFDGWELDLAKRELRRSGGDPIAITTGEFDLLRVFVANPNRVLDRDTLMNLVRGRDWAAYDRSIDAQVLRLRKRIEADPRNPQLIKTVRGAGYIFTGI
jgi:two-component system phosphate regulon response regulator OmpR